VNSCKVCGIVYSFATWKKLQNLGEKLDFGAHLQFRQCGCGNRLAILLDDDGEFLPEHPLDTNRDSK